MTDHPHDLLAEYVDGALGPEQRASVEAHLASCLSCREEVDLAARARHALAELPEVPAPAGIALGVRREARRPSRAGRWIAATAAAAVLAGVIVVTRGLVGGGAQRGGGGEAPAVPAETPRAEDQAEGEATQESSGLSAAASSEAVGFFESDRDYDPASLARLAPRLRARATESLRAGFAPTTERFFADLELDTVPPRARRAIRCASVTIFSGAPSTP